MNLVLSLSPSSLSFLWLRKSKWSAVQREDPPLVLPTADSPSVNDCLSRELSTRPTQPSPALYSVALVDETGESKALLVAVLGR